MAVTPYRDVATVPLAIRPTPLHRLPRLSRELGVDLWVKRDDLTGAALSGNKVRKLEYLLRDAVSRGADTVITCGGVQSNHARATAIAAAQLGLQSLLILRGEEPPRLEGNLLLDRMVGAHVLWVTPDEYRDRARIFDEQRRRLEAQGRRVALIPEGGSTALGALGYVAAMEEVAAQTFAEDLTFDTIVCAVGSGGTLAGLLSGARTFAKRTQVVGVNVCDDAPTFFGIVRSLLDDMTEAYGLEEVPDKDIRLLDGFVGAGYALSRPHELALLRHVAQTEGLLLDPVYTGKAFFGLRETLRTNRLAFGERVLFVHTGGLYGLFPKAADMHSVLAPDCE